MPQPTGLFGGTMSLLQRTLNLRSAQHHAVSANIANADTPHYRSFEVAVDEELRKLRPDGRRLEMARTQTVHMPQPVNPAADSVKLRAGVVPGGPVAFRYPRGPAVGCPPLSAVTPIRIGRAKVLKEGDDVVLMAIGASVMEALAAHDLLADQGIQATVVDCRFVKPLDVSLAVDLARQTPRILTIEENVRQGGFGSAVLEAFNDAGLNSVALERIGLPDAFVEHGPQSLLRNLYGLNAAAIARTAFRFLKQNDYVPNAGHSFHTRIAFIRP